MPVDEDQLLDQIRHRNPEALAQFAELRRRQLLAFLDRHVGANLRRKLELEDLLQETVAEAVRSLPAMDLNQRDPFGWLCQIAERRIIDAHRRLFGAQKRDAGREVPLEGGGGSDNSRGGLIDLLVASMTSASKAFSRDQRQIKLLGALEKLPADQREALRLRYLEGLPSKEIAQKMGKTDGAVRVMLTRSLSKLHSLIDLEADA